MRPWVEIETDIRYLQEESGPESAERCYFARWPDVPNVFERKLAANIQKRSVLRLDPSSFVRIAGLAAQNRDAYLTFSIRPVAGLIEARLVETARNGAIVPPITSDDAGGLEFALCWFVARALPCRLTVSPENLFWIPLD